MLKRIAAPVLTLLLIAYATTMTDGYAYGGHKWNVAEIPYYINPVTSDMTEDAAVSAIQTAAAAWSMQTNASIAFYYMGLTSGTTLANNGKNEVFFRNDTSPYLAETYRWWDGSGKLVDADTVIHTGSAVFFGGNTGCSGGYYLQNVMTHEFGHALGFDHSSVSTATMVAGEGMCTTWKESLDLDDITAVETVYPPGGGATTNTAPSVAISSPGNSSSFAQGTAVTFSGSASDQQDGTLSTQMTWYSSIDGQIGTGASFSRSLSAGTHTITAQVTDSGGLTASATRSVTITAPVNTAPTVTISAPANSSSDVQGTPVTFSGSATDKEDGNLSARLSWTSSIDGNLGTGSSFSKTLSLGTHTITARVTDSGGTTTSSSVTVTVTAYVNSAPVVTISSPVNGSSFADSSVITFTASATDKEDGNVSASIVWNSSLAGPLGMGATVSRTLSAGTHVITAQAADSTGATASKSITITVTSTTSSSSGTSPAITLTASGSKVKGRQTANLSWTGATSATVDVYRNNVRIVTTANDGAYTDSVVAGKGTYSYKVCEAGTSNCSATVNVRF
jgi:hypothetical protein